MNQALADLHASAIAACLGEPGRLVGLSKSGYLDAHPTHLAVFNANVCFVGGKVWWGDFDLTRHEQQLAELAALTGQTVYLLYESDGRFVHEATPLLDRAVYSVTPTGHTRFLHTHVERHRDGLLYERPAVRPPRFRRPGRPRLWRFWQIERRGVRTTDDLGERRSTVIYLGRRGFGARSPLLVLGLHRWSQIGRGACIEWTWYPSAHRRWAPSATARLKRHGGRLRPFVAVRLTPGVCQEVRVGVACGQIDTVWG